MVYFKRKLTVSKTTEYLSMSLVIQRIRSFVSLVSSCFWHVLAFSNLLWLVTDVSLFTSDGVTKCFDLYYKSTSTKECKSYYKRDSFFELQSGISCRKQISISTLIETEIIIYRWEPAQVKFLLKYFHI